MDVTWPEPTPEELARNVKQIKVTFSEQESVDIRLYCQEHGIDHQEYVDDMLKRAVMDRLYS